MATILVPQCIIITQHVEEIFPGHQHTGQASVQVQSNTATELMQCKHKFELWATKFGIKKQRVFDLVTESMQHKISMISAKTATNNNRLCCQNPMTEQNSQILHQWSHQACPYHPPTCNGHMALHHYGRHMVLQSSPCYQIHNTFVEEGKMVMKLGNGVLHYSKVST